MMGYKDEALEHTRVEGRKNMRTKIIHLLFGALAAISFAGSVYADVPKVSARISPDTVLIGDRFTLRVEVTKDLMQIVEFPEFNQKHLADSIEIVSEGPIDTLSKEGRTVTFAREYTLTCFDPSDYRMGKFPLLYIDKNTVDTIWSIDSMRIIVNTFEIDTTKQTIFDIKKPLAVPLQFREIGGYLLWALLALVLLGGAIYAVVRWMKKKPILGGEAKVQPPHVVAIHQLEKLRAQKLWQSGKEKQYYTALTDILRQYMEDRYRFRAMEFTSAEILDQLKRMDLSARSLERLSGILNVADFVKFAKYKPDIEQNETSFDEACYFVEETKETIQEEAIGSDDLNDRERKGVLGE